MQINDKCTLIFLIFCKSLMRWWSICCWRFVDQSKVNTFDRHKINTNWKQIFILECKFMRGQVPSVSQTQTHATFLIQIFRNILFNSFLPFSHEIWTAIFEFQIMKTIVKWLGFECVCVRTHCDYVQMGSQQPYNHSLFQLLE